MLTDLVSMFGSTNAASPNREASSRPSAATGAIQTGIQDRVPLISGLWMTLRYLPLPPPVGLRFLPRATSTLPLAVLFRAMWSCATSGTVLPGLRPRPPPGRRVRIRAGVDRFFGASGAAVPGTSPALRGPRTPRGDPRTDRRVGRGKSRNREEPKGKPRHVPILISPGLTGSGSRLADTGLRTNQRRR